MVGEYEQREQIFLFTGVGSQKETGSWWHYFLFGLLPLKYIGLFFKTWWTVEREFRPMVPTPTPVPRAQL